MKTFKTFTITDYGTCGSDQCCEYFINVQTDVTVEDVIKDILNVKREWGSIFVILKQLNIKKEYEIRYENEKILPMSEYERGLWHILQFLKVKSMRGHGGWSASDYWLEVEI